MSLGWPGRDHDSQTSGNKQTSEMPSVTVVVSVRPYNSRPMNYRTGNLH